MKSSKKINRLLQKFLLNELDPTEQELVDRVIGSNKEINDAIILRKKIDKSLKKSDILELRAKLEEILKQKKHPTSFQEPIIPYLSWYQTAAMIILLIGLGYFTTLFLRHLNTIQSTSIAIKTEIEPKSRNNSDFAETNYLKSLAPISDINIDDQKQLIEKKSIIQTESDSKLFVNNFNESAYFESLIGNFRSHDLTVISPTHNEEFFREDNITFSWEESSQPASNYLLSIFNSRETLILQTHIENNFTYIEELQPGLYYWKIEYKDKLMHFNKFRISYKN